MNLDLTGRTAWVGGSSKGIGWAAAQALAHQGARVILVARNASLLEERLETLPRPSGANHLAIVADYDDPAQVQAQAEQHLQANGPVHILVNNTGGPPGGPIHLAKPEEFDAALRRHLHVNHRLMQAFLPGLKAAQWGRIINVISTSVKQPLAGLGVSNTTRWAVAAWAKTLATELAPLGITVNNVLPGATATERLDAIIQTKATKTGAEADAVSDGMVAAIPAGRFGAPQEMGDAIAFLASPSAAYITGINLPVDGGRLGVL